MNRWHYQNPVAIHFGAGALETLPQLLGGRRDKNFIGAAAAA